MTSNKSWPIGIAVVYGSFVLFLVAYLMFSQFHKVDLVSPDYYAREIEYQQQIDRMARTRALPQPVEVSIDNRAQRVSVQFPQNLPGRPGQVRGTATFFRPSDARKDYSVPLQLDARGNQQIEVAKLAKGLWKLQLSWNLGGVDYFNEEVLVIR